MTAPAPKPIRILKNASYLRHAAVLLWATMTSAQAPSPVRVDAVRLESVQEQRMVTGEIRAVHRSKVATQEEGILKELFVKEGDQVEKGSELARFDSARLSILLVGREADLRAADALVVQRQVELDMMNRDVERIKKAVRSGAANEKEILDAQSDASASAAVLAEAESRSASNRALIELLQTRLDDMTIRAPFDGVIISRDVEIGEWLDAGDQVVEILSTSKLEAWLDVPQHLLGPAQANHSKISVLDARTGQAIASERGRVIPLVDQRARTFPIVVSVDNTKGDIAPGVAVTGSAPTGAVVERLTIDRDAILRNEAGPYVYVLRESGGDAPSTAQLVSINPLFDFHGRLVIGFGALAPGDLVVVEGNERLHPSSPVVAVDPGEDEATAVSDNDDETRSNAGG